VAASPVVADLDKDGWPEVVVGSWDRRVYVWRPDGSPLPGWPRPTGHFVWATAAVGDLDGDGRPEVAAVSDQVYVWRSDGRPLGGWPQPLGSFGVAAPVVADLDADGRPELVAADRLYAWRGDGRPPPGFPVDLGAFLWATPLVADLDGDGRPEIAAGGWDGILRLVRADGSPAGFFRAGGPLFAPPVLLASGAELLVAAWDGRVYRVPADGFSPRPPPAADWPTRRLNGRIDLPAGRPVFAEVDGAFSARAVLFYRRIGEQADHPVPLVAHRGRLVGLLPPFSPGTRGEIWVSDGAGKPVAVGRFRAVGSPAGIVGRLRAALRRRRRWTWGW